MEPHHGSGAFDPEAVRAKYRAERDRRLVPGRSEIRDLDRDERFARFGRRPLHRAPRPRAAGRGGRRGDRRGRHRRGSWPGPS